jgi:phage terminase large subunit
LSLAEVEVTADFPAKLQPLFKPARYKVLYGGRGGAKSWGVARALLILVAERGLRILCTREVQNSIKDSVHRLLGDQIKNLGYESLFTVLRDEIRCNGNGGLFLFAGLSDLTVDSIKSFEGVDVVWVEEGHSVTKRSWSILIPTIRKDGSEIWVTFNPELDTDETYVRFVVTPPPDTVLIPMSWRDNPWFSDLLRKEKDHLEATDKEEYENVWEGKPRTVVAGAIYGKEVHATIEGRRFRPVPYDPLLLVHTVWDLGWNDQTTIIFVQRLGGELRVIDYYEESFTTYAQDVQALEKRGYRYGDDWLPHDGRSKTKAADGKSPEELLRTLGRKPLIVSQHDVEVGIKAARLVFGRCYFDVDKTGRLMECLKRYRRRINQTTQQPEGPLHDEYSHGADAFRGLAMIADKLPTNAASTWGAGPIKYDNRGIR